MFTLYTQNSDEITIDIVTQQRNQFHCQIGRRFVQKEIQKELLDAHMSKESVKKYPSKFC